jgi:phage tail-like protein
MADANGLRFWMLSERGDWPELPESLAYDTAARRLRLSSTAHRAGFAELQSGAEDRLKRVPQTIDIYGNRAYWDAAAKSVMADGARPGAVSIFTPAPGTEPTGLACGEDGVLFVALDGGVTMVDLKKRWKPQHVAWADAVVWRLLADPRAGAWVLSQKGELGRLTGMPLPDLALKPDDPNVAGRCDYNPNAPRIEKWSDAPWTGNAEEAVAIALHPQSGLGLLSWAGGKAWLRLLNSQTGAFAAPVELKGVRFPYSFCWLAPGRIAVLVDGLTEAPAFDLAPGSGETHITGDFYPLRDFDPQPFVESLFALPNYGTLKGTRALRRVSITATAARGAVRPVPIDGEDARMVWHRLYVEAAIPPQCGIRIFCAASDSGAEPAEDAWFEHVVGDDAPAGAGVPRAAWSPYASEVPFHKGLFGCVGERSRAGLFTVLIQRAGRRVRTLQGRYLHLRVALEGNGRATPEIAALRAYGSRFSYLNRYLPELYRELVFDPEASAVLKPGEPTTAADFLERFLDNFEGILTPLEDRIANAHVLTSPATTRDDSMEWLAAWVGMSFDSAVPPPRRRDMLKASAELGKWRGTLRGLELALDLATGGSVRQGEVVVVENYRLRRIFATILGVDLTDRQDPLLPGASQSGNSIIGDTLFLGDESKSEFLALFDASLQVSLSERQQIARLFDSLAHRVTVLVHREIDQQALGLIRRVVAAEKPAHVQALVAPAQYALLAGLAALIGVDTYLTERLQPGPIRLGVSKLGVWDVVKQPPSLDPRLEGGLPARKAIDGPVAVIKADAVTPLDRLISLDGSSSRPSTGATLEEFRWSRIK